MVHLGSLSVMRKHSSRFPIFRISKFKLFETVFIILGVQDTIPVIALLLLAPPEVTIPSIRLLTILHGKGALSTILFRSAKALSQRRRAANW